MGNRFDLLVDNITAGSSAASSPFASLLVSSRTIGLGFAFEILHAALQFHTERKLRAPSP